MKIILTSTSYYIIIYEDYTIIIIITITNIHTYSERNCFFIKIDDDWLRMKNDS